VRVPRQNRGIGTRHDYTSAYRDRDHEERRVPITDVPRHVALAQGILQQDKVPRPQPPDRPVGRLHLDRTRHEGQELPGGTRVPVANPAGLKRIEAILRCGLIPGDVERGSGGRSTCETLFDRYRIKVRATLCVRVYSVILHKGMIGREFLSHG